jgi:uncharacterized protein (DUF58 family)
VSGRGALLARLLNPAALARYEGLVLKVRRGLGDRPGERRFPGRPQPSGSELESYTPYAAGDDLRHLDWNAVGRLDALLVRRYTAEREVLFHVLVDCSASMTVPARDAKLTVALELAMALVTMALTANDAVRIALLAGGSAPAGVSPLYRQRASIPRAAEFLASADASGALDLAAALEHHGRRFSAPANALVISDCMMDAAAIERGLHALRARRYEVQLLHVIGRAELEPERDFSEAVLEDVESGETHAIALSVGTLARYRDLLAAHLAAVAAVAERTRTAYARLATDGGVDTLVGELAERGLVGRR